jgi:hypothetical protein
MRSIGTASSQTVKDVWPDGMTLGNSRMIEVTQRISQHADTLHDSLGSDVSNVGEGDDLR